MSTAKMIWKYVMADLNFSGVVTFNITKYNALIRKIVNTTVNGRIPKNQNTAATPFVIPMVMIPAKFSGMTNFEIWMMI